jgi:hypothetical protein
VVVVLLLVGPLGLRFGANEEKSAAGVSAAEDGADWTGKQKISQPGAKERRAQEQNRRRDPSPRTANLCSIHGEER